VTFPYNPEYITRIKAVRAHRWHPEEKYWSFPYSKPVLMEILSTFAGEKCEIDPSLQTLVSQNQGKTLTHIRTSRGEPLPTQSEETAETVDTIENEVLFDRVRRLIRLKHYSIRTEKSYLPWIMRYILFHNKRDPKEMANPEIEAYLSHLAVDLNVSAATQTRPSMPCCSSTKRSSRRSWMTRLMRFGPRSQNEYQRL